MIFNNNYIDSDMVVDEFFNPQEDLAMALIESAKSDYSMFEAMMNIEARAVKLEMTDSINESSYIALQEASIKGIWEKIVAIFTSLINKIKDTFTKYAVVFKSAKSGTDKLINKYRSLANTSEKEDKANNAELKGFRKVKSSVIEHLTSSITDIHVYNLDDLRAAWKGNASDTTDYFYSKSYGGATQKNIREKIFGYYFEDKKDTMTIKEFGGIDNVIKDLKDFNSTKIIYRIGALDNYYKNLIKEAKKQSKSGNNDDVNLYNCAKVYQKISISSEKIMISAVDLEYKQNKAALIKAIAAIKGNSSKDSSNTKEDNVEESYLSDLADLYMESCISEAEVTDILDKAIDNDEDISDLNIASDSVLDNDVSDDPDYLTYDDDCYTEHEPTKKKDGEVDTEIDSKSEASFFGELLY